MSEKKTLWDNVIDLFPRDVVLPELPIEVQPAPEEEKLPLGCAVDLTGRPKVVMAFGAGRSGKSTLLRWAAERVASTVVLATADELRPTLKVFVQGTMVLKYPVGVEKLIERLMAVRDRTAMIDFGADRSLVPLLRQMPDLQKQMEDAGLQPVVLYVLTPRESDLSVLVEMEHAGFRPTATALIRNMGTMMTVEDTEWNQLRRHSAYRAAVVRGAVELWMPRLYPAKAVEDRRIGFMASVDPASGLSVFERSKVTSWLNLMDGCFAPVKSWLEP